MADGMIPESPGLEAQRVSDDGTLPQTSDELRAAVQRSLQRTHPPLQVPGYQVERFLGAGAYGEVWVARDRNTGRQVAMKFYTHRGGLDWSLLSREVEKLAFLFADRYVVQLIDVGWDADPPYYIMEYLTHGSLAERLKKGPMPVPEAVALFRDVATGLVHAHGKGVLHCDLKPANILLDQDLRPRLADFGQSRMSTEQRPALGTLFYMAPEQANLEATPDARWDVYALGAVLYCMLTGEPPYRTESAATLITQGSDLTDQLKRYQDLLRIAPRPTRHRRLPGVTRDLWEIVERCLAINPAKRYPNPQAVLDALHLRAIRKARRPLLILGALGPAILLAVMTWFSWAGAETAVHDSEQALVARASESDRFAARFVAETVAKQIDRRWYALSEDAADPEFRKLVAAATGQPRDSEPRRKLQDALTELRNSHPDLTEGTWMLLDADGTQLARSPFDTKTLDVNFAYRDYFNGLGKDLDPRESHPPPIRQPHRSHVYYSSSAGKWMMAYTVPVWAEKSNERVIGVLGISTAFGHFAALRPENEREQNLIASLVDTREDGGPTPRKGLVVEHPQLDHQTSADRKPDIFLQATDVARLETLRRRELARVKNPATANDSDELDVESHYVDPVDSSSGRWLAAFDPVFVNGRPPEVSDTGLVVVIQERYNDIVAPARDLGHLMMRSGLIAVAFVLAVLTILWGFVIVVLNESPRFRLARLLRRRAGIPSAPVGTNSPTASTGTGMPSEDPPLSSAT
jgi:eukaryotic-like serine/threonine-protein kinase